MTSARTPEKVVQAQIVKLLKQVGARVYVLGTRRGKNDFQGTRQTPGLPDLIAFVPARHVVSELLVIEVKAERGRLSQDQKDFAGSCVNANVWYVSGGLNDVIKALVIHGNLKE